MYIHLNVKCYKLLKQKNKTILKLDCDFSIKFKTYYPKICIYIHI